MSSEISDLTTDAVPSPNNTKNKTEQDKFESDEEKLQDTNEDDITNKSINSFSNPRFTQFKTTKVPTAQATVINIVNSSNIQVGDQKHFHFNNRSEVTKTKRKVRETSAIKSLKASGKKLETDDLLFISTHLGEAWKDIMRSLKYLDGQIEQFYIDNHQLGTKEVIYQSLLDWTRNEPREATVGKLCQTLWDNDQRDIVKLWSEKV